MHRELPAQEAIENAAAHQSRPRDHARAAANWFHEREGTLFRREDVLEDLAEALELGTGFDDPDVEPDLDVELANRIVAELVDDLVDPIVQTRTGSGRYVGVVEYVEGETWYGYERHDDVRGCHKRGVCAQCVAEKDVDREIVRADEGSGSISEGATWDEIGAALAEHFDEAHPDVDPATVETGATLLSGTTIAGNTSWHAGNDGAGSGLNADQFDGNELGDLRKNERTISVNSNGGSEVIYVAELTKDGYRRFAVDATAHFAYDYGVNFRNREIGIYAGQFNNGQQAEHWVAGEPQSGGEVHWIISETTDNSNSNTDLRYHLYLLAEDYYNGHLTLRTDGSPNIQNTNGLTESDILGTVVYDTRNDAPSRRVEFGPGRFSEMTAKVSNGVVNAAHSEFSSLQDGIDYANNNGHGEVYIPSGEYSQTIDVPRGITVTGAGGHLNDGTALNLSTSETLVEITGANSVVQNIRTRNTGTGLCVDMIADSGTYTNAVISNAGARLGGINNRFVNVYLGDQNVTIDGDNCVVDDLVFVDSITNNGSGNAIGETT